MRSSLVVGLVVTLAAGCGSTSASPSSEAGGAGSGGASSEAGAEASAAGAAGDAGPTGDAGASWIKETVVDATARHAVCNDGSPAVYFFHRATDPSKRADWIVYLQAGSSCDTEKGCAFRWKFKKALMSTVHGVGMPKDQGILATSASINPDFHGWNLVSIWYCSSDDWQGARDKNGTSPSWYFRGKAIVRDVIQDLKNASVVGSPTLAQAKALVFTGSSAGGTGVVADLDDVAAMVPGADVKGVIDSGWFPDIAMYGGQSLEQDAQTRYEYHDAQPDASCVAAHPSDPYMCALAPVAEPYITTPHWVYQDQLDHVVLGGYGVKDPITSAESPYVAKFAQQIRCDLSQLDGAFSTRVGQHIGLGQKFNDPSLAIQGHLYRDVLGNWYFNRSGPKKLIDVAADAGACP